MSSLIRQKAELARRERLQEEERLRLIREQKKGQGRKAAFNISNNLFNISTKYADTVNKAQESKITNTGAFNVEYFTKLKDKDEFIPIKPFRRNSFQSSDNPVVDYFKLNTAPAKDRIKLDSTFAEAVKNNNIYDKQGNVVTEFKDIEDVFSALDNKYETGDVNEMFNMDSMKPSIDETVTSTDEIVSKLESLEPKVASESTPIQGSEVSIAPKKNLLGNYTKGFKEGSSIADKAASTLNIASSVYNASRVVTEEDPIEKMHAAINTAAPIITAAVAGTAAAPIAAGALMVNTIWDILD